LKGEYIEAESKLNLAMGIFNALNARYQIGRTLFEMGELSTAQIDTAKARDYFIRALESFESMQATPDAERAKAALKRLN
jgi:hypothetical protein